MIQIKFKGQRVDNKKWVYGYLYQSKKQSWITDLINININTHRNFAWWEVIPETVGQFTGLKDCKGVDIYEGDIYHQGDLNITYTVVWHDTGFKGKQNSSTSYAGLEYWKDRIEVVGNIHNK